MTESIDWQEVEAAMQAAAVPPAAEPLTQLDRIEAKLDAMLAFRDLLLETAGPFLTGGKSKVWLALLAKSKGAPRT